MVRTLEETPWRNDTQSAVKGPRMNRFNGSDSGWPGSSAASPRNRDNGGLAALDRRHPERREKRLRDRGGLRALGSAAALVLLLFSPAPRTDDLSADERFLAGLREHRLFELAETYCTGRLEALEPADPRRAPLVIELSRTLADWAVNSPPDARAPRWQRAVAVTDEFAGEHPESPRLLPVRLQGALAILTRGELACQEAPLVAGRDRRLEEARSALTSANRSLEALAADVEEALRARNRPGRHDPVRGDAEALSVHQLASLRDNIRYQLARAYRNRAQCYAPGSPDRTNSLTLAAEMIEPLARLDKTHPLGWKSRIDEIACYRLLGDHAAALKRLEATWQDREDLAPALRLRLLAEWIRLALAAGDLSQATRLASEERAVDGVTSPERDFAALEAYLAAWQAASESAEEKEAARWQAAANDMVRVIRSEHGPYWTRRAQMLLSRYVRGLPGADLQTWIQAAENAFHSGQYDDALENYDRARTLALEDGNADEAFRLGFTAATIEHRRGRHEEAASRYRQVAAAAPDHEKAPQAHLLALHHAGQAAAQASDRSLDRYVAIAREHLATWPDGPTADEVRRRLGGAYELQRRWREAVEQYQAITPGSPKFAEVVGAVARAYTAWLEEAPRSGRPTGQIAAAAAAWFESLIVGPEGRLPERWSPVARRAAVEAARFRLNHGCGDPGRAERILSDALGRTEHVTAEWESTARALLALSLAAQGRREEATDALQRISAGSPDELLKILQGLAQIGASSAPEAKAELAELELSLVELLREAGDKLSAEDRRTLDTLAAQALADAGRTDAALEAFRRLARAHPQDGPIQEGYARLLLTRADAAGLEAALQQWREVEKKSRPGTDRWFRAKLALALVHARADNRKQAEKVLRLVEILHPEPKLRDRRVTARFLDSLRPEMQARLRDLLESL